jgi:chemotaxis methyl-accepting protein methylase
MSGSVDTRHISFTGVAAQARRLPPAFARRSSRALVPAPAPAVPTAPASSLAFASWVLRQAALDPSVYREHVLARRLPACLRLLKVPTVSAARQRLETRRDLLPSVLSTLLIGVTGFFRDRPVFDDLRALVLPRLAGRGSPPRAWSAACSTGAELYSLAILLDEAGLLEGATLLGTDCREEAIAEARAGIYGPPATGTLPGDYLPDYFTPGDGAAVCVAARLRASTRWKATDLHARLEPGPWDVVLWRNSAIYLERYAADTLYRQIAGTLVPGGFLVVGKAERPPVEAGLVRAAHCLYQKPGARDAD